MLDALLDRSIFFSFDRGGYLRHRRRFVAADLEVDLSGRRCLVTGANSGLGRAAARELARLGAEVWLLCRDARRGAEAEREMGGAGLSGQVRLELVDVSSLASVRDFAARVGDARVDALVHNAGVLPAVRTATGEGLELTLATNLVGPFLLTWLLLPNLLRSDDARVVSVSSGGMYGQRLDLERLERPPEPFDGVIAYAQTKRAQVVMSELWAERLGRRGIACNAMHPGWAATRGVERSLPRFWRLMKSRLRSAEEGADTIVWLAAARSAALLSGRFFFDRRVASTHLVPWTRERDGDRRRLWDLCCRLAGVDGDPAGAGSERRSPSPG